MDGFKNALLIAGVVLLVFAFLFLIFTEIAAKLQEKRWEARRQAALRKRFSHVKQAPWYPDSEPREDFPTKTEVSAEEKAALRMATKEKLSEGQTTEEIPADNEHTQPPKQ